MSKHIYPKDNKQQRPNSKKQKRSKKLPLYCPFCQQSRFHSQATKLLELEKIYNARHGHLYRRPLEPGWTIKAAEKNHLVWACDVCLKEKRAIPSVPWLQLPTMGYPEFAYADKPMTCEDCGVDFVFSASEQQFWYERLQFVTYSFPKQCPKCRHERRVQKKHQHDLQQALASLDDQSALDLAYVASCYVQTGKQAKALEFYRRAKNKAGSQKQLDELQQIIRDLENNIESENS